MPELKISEAGSVQFPMVAHAAAIGWTAIPPEVAKQKRGGEAGMLFRDELEAVLARFNPWLSADVIRQLIEKLEAIPPTVEGNRDMLSWLRGERQWYDEAGSARMASRNPMCSPLSRAAAISSCQ